MSIEFCEEVREVRRIRGLDADECWSLSFVPLFQIFESCDIIIWTEEIDKFFQCARTLREGDEEISLASLMLEGAFLHFMESFEVEIAPREDYNDLLSHDLMLHLIESRRGESTGWFRDDPFLMQKLEHRGTDSILMHGEYLEIICFRDCEISLTDAPHAGTIHEGLDLIEGNILMRFEGSEHRRRSLRLHSDNASIRTKSTECRDQTTHESSPSDRTEDDIRTHISESLIDLESDTALSSDDTLIIEWMDEY